MKADGLPRRPPSTANPWEATAAPSLDDIRELATAAYNALPAPFHALCGGAIEIRVADFAEDDVLEAVDAGSPFDLMGLFEGEGLAQADAMPRTGQMPNRIWLYRRPILDYWAEIDDPLGAIVTHVLIHEIGHHFGLSDDDMTAIETAAL